MDRAKQKTNAPPLLVGDRVLPLAYERTPLDSKWDLPKEVTHLNGPVVWCRPITGAGKIVALNRAQLKKFDLDSDWRDIQAHVSCRQRSHEFPTHPDQPQQQNEPQQRHNVTVPKNSAHPSRAAQPAQSLVGLLVYCDNLRSLWILTYP